jgi:DNA-binding NarL/FixJ family response regulator
MTETTNAATVALALAGERAEGGTAHAAATPLYTGGSEDRRAHALHALAAAGIVAGAPVPLVRRTLDGAPVRDDDGNVMVWDTESPAYRRHFTPQRLAILATMAEGLSYTETADRLHLNVGTVKSHRRNLYRTFGAHSGVECFVEAVRCGVLPHPLAEVEEAPAPRPRRNRRTAAPAAE